VKSQGDGEKNMQALPEGDRQKNKKTARGKPLAVFAKSSKVV